MLGQSEQRRGGQKNQQDNEDTLGHAERFSCKKTEF